MTDRGALYPLTSLQRSMVLALQRAPHSGAYILQYVCQMAEDVDAALLQSTWRMLARRHAAFRTSFTTGSDGQVWQQVHEQAEVPWLNIDWSDLPEDQRNNKLAEFLREDFQSGFNFDDGVPTRFTLIRMAEHSYTLIWIYHHALMDGRSLALAWKEWFAVYDALHAGEKLELAQAKDFREHVHWLQQQDLSLAEQFWRSYFANLSQNTDYITDRIRPSDDIPIPGTSKQHIEFSEELTTAVELFVKRHNLTVNTLVQAAWALLLARYSDRTDIVFGAARAARQSSATGSAPMVGMLMNTLPIRITVSPETPLLTWLKQIREQWIQLREHEHTPIEKIWEWSGLPPGMPPYDNLLIYENRVFADTMRRLGGNWQHRSITRMQRTDSPLTLVAHGRPLMSLEIVYNQSLFGRELISGMTRHLHTLLQSFLAQPESPLADLKMLAEPEELVLQEVNQTQIDYPRNICVHRLFEQQAARLPDHPAFDSPGGIATYREVNQRANRLAAFLRARGVGAEDFVAVCIERSPEAVLAVLGIVKTGAAFLPLDPRLPEARLLPMLHDARPKFVLADDASFPKLCSYGPAVLNLKQLASELALQPDENLPDLAAPHNAAYAIYTSGSTGTPKAVVVTHGSLVNYVLAAGRAYEISDADRRLQFSWMGADFFVAEVFNNLSAGATLVFCLDQQGNSVTEFLRLLDQQRITITGMPSSWWHEWVRSFSKSGFTPPRSLRVVVTGMEQVNPAALHTWKQEVGARIRWFNAYGPTETTCTSTIYEAGSSTWEGAQYVPIGKPVANTQVYVLDRQCKPVPAGVPGELYIAGDGVARGYLNSPELTVQRFLPDPFSANPANRMYRTGDRVFSLPDGNLVFLGRLDRQVKIRGFRVELDEIEAVVAKHPSVRECAVVVHNERLIAYVSSANQALPEIQQLRRHASAHLATHMLPAAFVVLPNMPLTLSGKIDRQSLPPFDPELLAANREFQEASTPTEKLLAALWQQVLGVAVTDATANFFELGGDSLRAAQLILLIQRQFGQEFPFATLLRAPTIQRVAAILDSGDPDSADTNAGWDAVFPLQIQGSLPPFFCISPTLQGPYCYRHLSKHLGTSQPFFVVRVLPKESERVPTIEELAERAIQSIRATKPHGPYVLAGYCFGGSIAFETARRLKSMGEEVRMIVLFDTAAPGYPKVFREHRRNWRQLRDVFAGSSDNRIGVRQIISHLDTTGRMIKRKVLGKTERQIARYQLDVLAPPVESVEKWQLRSACMYEVKPTDIPVAQFVAQDQAISTRILADPRLAWRELCTGDFHLLWVSGSHGTLLGETESPEVARLISGLLQKAQPKKMSGAAG